MTEVEKTKPASKKYYVESGQTITVLLDTTKFTIHEVYETDDPAIQKHLDGYLNRGLCLEDPKVPAKKKTARSSVSASVSK